MKNFLFFIISAISVLISFGQTTPIGPSNTKNYIHEIVYKKGYQVSGLNEVSGDDKIESVNYFDGLGRSLQTVAVRHGGNNGTGTNSDLVTPVIYDDFGRQVKTYLPYAAKDNNGKFHSNAFIVVHDFYESNYTSDFTLGSSNPYSETRYEASPLNRILEQGAPGSDWKINPTSDSDHTIKFAYQTNKTNEVRLYTVSLTAGFTPTLQNPSGSFYLAGELFKTITKDENWSPNQTNLKNHTTEEFKDIQGQVVLKRTYGSSDINMDGDSADPGESNAPHDTYYVYDDYGNLTYVLPPKSESQTAKPDANELAELCYQYKYDDRNRLIEKKIPGKDWEFIVYNMLDQPILTQDRHLRDRGMWAYTKYDAFGRVVITGLLNNSANTQSAMNTIVENYYNNNPSKKAWEAKTTSSTYNYYTNDSYPTSGYEVLTLNYYDNYTFNPTTQGILLSAGTPIYDENVSYQVKGLPTGSRVKVLDQSTAKWITTITHYDDMGKVIYTGSYNELLETTDLVKSDLDFTGNVLTSERTHKRTGHTDIVTTDTFEYDHVMRLTKHNQSINGGSQEVIAENTYDELGQLVGKGVGNADGSSRLQNVAYEYNVRGWLKKINNPLSLGDNLFSFAINYNDPTHSGTALYNGNISEAEWKTQNDNVLRYYRYSYDDLNRITSGLASSSNYNLASVVYDKNGNITKLTRNGYQGGATYTNMDVLAYGYNTSSNQLKTVNDSGNLAYGFKDNSSALTQYTYDTNGNLTSDLNKGIGTSTIPGIIYNHLNLPTSITLPGGTITYTYDATGVKLEKKVAESGKPNNYTFYTDNFVYKRIGDYGNGTLEFFSTPEGYVSYDNGQFNYVYNYVDHLGNVRLSYTNTGSASSPNLQIIEENNYYPFGLKHEGYNPGISSLGSDAAKKFKYNGIEFEESAGLDLYEMDFRNYDPALGRFTGIDPVTHHSMSPYVAFDNNPIFWVDPSGADATDPIKETNRVISSRVDEHNVTHITQTTTTTTTTTNDDGSVSVSYSSGSITNTVDANGKVTNGSSVTTTSGNISRDADGNVSASDPTSTTRSVNGSDNTSALGEYTGVVSDYNAGNDGVYNKDKINELSSKTTNATRAGVAVLSIFGPLDNKVASALEKKLGEKGASALGLVGVPTSLDGTTQYAGSALTKSIGENNGFMMIYGVEQVRNGVTLKTMKTPSSPDGNRKRVGPTSFQDLWKGIKSIFN